MKFLKVKKLIIACILLACASTALNTTPSYFQKEPSVDSSDSTDNNCSEPLYDLKDPF